MAQPAFRLRFCLRLGTGGARAAFQVTSYAVPLEELRNQKDWNPEWSRRGRGFAAYAALRHLGREGLCELVERCCRHASRLVEGISALPGAEAVARPVINQGLMRFLASDGDHDGRTDAVIAKLQDSGEVWFGGVTWKGKRAMRISVCNWLTSDQDVETQHRCGGAGPEGVKLRCRCLSVCYPPSALLRYAPSINCGAAWLTFTPGRARRLRRSRTERVPGPKRRP